MVVEKDTDGDGYIDSVDLDDDNDGILDTDECGQTFVGFEGSATTFSVLTGTAAGLGAGDKILRTNAVSLNGTNYDAVITINKISGETLSFDTGNSRLNLAGPANNNNYVTYSIVFVTSGSATTTNPNGTPVSLKNVWLRFPSLNGATGRTYVDIAGYKNAPDAISLGSNVSNLPFVAGTGNSEGFTTIRPVIPAAAATIGDLTYSYQLWYATYGTAGKEFIFGYTGNDTGSAVSRAFFNQVYVECDIDGDGIANRLDVDSDNDGCFDAIEGGSSVMLGQVNDSTGQITGGVDGNGVPLLVGASGQTVNNAQNSSISDCYVNATNDINQASVGYTVSGNLTTNDTYAGTSTVSSARYYNALGVLTALPFGTATQVYTSAGILSGTMTLNSNGTYTFVPTNGFVGTAPLNYTLTNSVGVSDTADLSIEVKNGISTYQNDAPIAQNDTAATKINVAVSSTVLSNDSDPDGNMLTLSVASVTLGIATGVSGTDVNGNAVANAGSITLNANGTYTFTPSAGFIGSINPISYTVSDGNGGSDSAVLSISVNRDLGNTVYPNDDANVAPKGTTMSGNILSNDTDPENNTLAITAATANGTSFFIGTQTSIPGVGTLTLNSNGMYTFMPLSTYVGTTTVVYTVCDNATPTPSCKQATLYLTSLKWEVCTIAGNMSGTPSGYATTGISILNSHLSSNWPTTVSHSFLSIESLSKGLVITRMDSPETQIQVAVEGMIVWDNDDNCMKLYTTSQGWHCISQGCKQ